MALPISIVVFWVLHLWLAPIVVRGDEILPWFSGTSRGHQANHVFSRRKLSTVITGGHPTPSQSFPPLAFAYNQADLWAYNQADLWALRIASAGLTYFGFVAYNDRPRGRLMVPESSVQIKESLVPGAGLGLFLAQDLPRGTVLGEYPGVVLPLAQHAASTKMQQAPQSEAYIWRFSDNQFVIDPTDGNGILQPECRGGNPSTPLSVPLFATLLSFVTVPTALCRINEPPKGRDVNVVTEEDRELRTVTFKLERDCYANEELRIDYGLSYDRSMYGPPPSD